MLSLLGVTKFLTIIAINLILQMELDPPAPLIINILSNYMSDKLKNLTNSVPMALYTTISMFKTGKSNKFYHFGF